MASGTNNDNINFAASDIGDDATFVHLYNQAAGGVLLWARQLTNNPSAIQDGQRYRIPTGMITITQPVGVGESEEMARKAIRGRISGIMYAAVATGLNANNVLTPPARVAIPESLWDVT